MEQFRERTHAHRGKGHIFYRTDAAIYGALALSGALRRSRLIDFKEAYHGT